MSDCPRPLAACLIVVGIIFAAPLIDSAFATSAADAGEGGGFTGLDASSLVSEGNGRGAEGFLSRIEALAGARAGNVPEGFDAEIGLLPDARDVRASGSVVGYVVEGECPDVAASLRAQMERRGWTGVSLVGVEGFTFSKPAGRLVWALCTCEQVGSATSVVIRLG